MKFILRDNQRIGSPVIGTIELEFGYGPVEIANLVRSGWLFYESEANAAAVQEAVAEQAKNDASLDAIQAEIDAKASMLPEGVYALEDLTGKQLKALCAARGLETTGNKFDLIDRLEKAPVEDKPKKKAKK
mgnify:FL=1